MIRVSQGSPNHTFAVTWATNLQDAYRKVEVHQTSSNSNVTLFNSVSGRLKLEEFTLSLPSSVIQEVHLFAYQFQAFLCNEE